MNNYRKLLLFISESLLSQDFDKLKFACESEIPAGTAQRFTQPFQFFSELERRNLLSEKDQGYLIGKFVEINRGDLRDKLREFQGNALNNQQIGTDATLERETQSETDDASDNQQQETDATQESETESEAEEEPFPDLIDLSDALNLYPPQHVHGEETDAEFDLR